MDGMAAETPLFTFQFLKTVNMIRMKWETLKPRYSYSIRLSVSRVEFKMYLLASCTAHSSGSVDELLVEKKSSYQTGKSQRTNS